MDRYQLAPLRGVRDRDERVQRGNFAAAVHDARATAEQVAAAAERVAAARAVLAAAVATRAALVDAGARPALIVLAERYAARRRRDLEAALGAEVRARASHAGRIAAVDEARDRLAVARAGREVVERHFARWRDQQQKLADRRED